MSPEHTVPSLARQMLSEGVGTFLLVFFGCGVVHTAVLTGAQQGLWQVAIVWGVSIMLAIYSVGGVSGAHINPAMTLAFAVWRRFPASKLLPYVAAQLTGAFIAAAALYVLFGPQLQRLEQRKAVTRGGPGSEITAMCYGEYFPNPGGLAAGDSVYSVAEHTALRALVPWHVAWVAECIGTAILGMVVFAVTDSRNGGRPAEGHAPVFIGLTVAALISVIAPLTQACFNPARDFGPRLFASLAGWGPIAWSAGSDYAWLTVYIGAPAVGAVLGAGVYEFLIRPSFAPCSN
ncbi:MAG: MIP/aquaporin family protein [Pirellulaceae bacterium]